MWLLLPVLAAPAPVSCRTQVRMAGASPSSAFAAVQTPAGLLIPAHVTGHPDTLWLLFDSGAGRTVLDRDVAQRLDLHVTAKGTISGVGVGATVVDIASDVGLSLPGVRITHIDMRLASIPGESQPGQRHVDGIIGFDLLCRAAVTIDYEHRRFTVTMPAAFRAPPSGDVLPLTIRTGWSFVRGTIKVPGQPPVEDEFILDTGSQDFVNHPIIRQSTGALRQTRTGAGGFGESQPGVIGENEWFRLGRTTMRTLSQPAAPPLPRSVAKLGRLFSNTFA